jgi:hypothetical protein
MQYNKLDSISYTFTPIIKVAKIKEKKVVISFVGISYSTFNSAAIGGGLFYHNLGLEYQYQISLKENQSGHFFSLKYKF